MKNFNLYKLIWLILGIILIFGVVLGIILFAKQTNNDKRFKKREVIAPKYVPGKVPGEITSQSQEPNLSGQYDKNNMSIPTTNPKLIDNNAPLSGNAIKIPDEPALPPNEEDIINLNILDGRFSLKQAIAKKGSPVIMRIFSQDKDYYFYIDGVGIAETINAEKYLTVSFRAPTKETELKYWVENTKEKGETDQGKLIIN